MEVLVHYAFMCVPERLAYAKSQAAVIEPAPDIMVDIRRKGVWWNAANAWRSVRSWATHHCVIQDDVELCADFQSQVEQAVAANPDNAIGLYVPLGASDAADRAAKRGEHWITSPKSVFGQAVLMPSRMALEFILWERKHFDPGYIHDDVRIAHYLVAHNKALWIPVPGLVQHVGGERSTLHHSAKNRYSDHYRGSGTTPIDWRIPPEPARSSQNLLDWNAFRP